MPGGSGGGGTVNTSNTTSTNMGPWNQQGPYLQQGFAQAGNLLGNTKPTYYPGSTVSPFTAGQSQGYQDIINRASDDPFMPQAQSQYSKTLYGSYLNPSTNPYLTDTYNVAADAVGRTFQNVTAPTTDAMFAANGPVSGGARFNAQNNNNMGLGQTLNNLATQIYGGNYQAERDRQNNDTMNVGSMIQAGFLDPTYMAQAGGAQQAQNQAQLGDQVARWNTEQNPDALWQQLAKYMSMVGGNYGQSGTSVSQGQQPYYSNPVGMGIGGLLGAGSLAGQLGWQPFGATAAGGGLAHSLGGALSLAAVA